MGVALVMCQAFKPVSLVLPANRSTDTVLTRAQVSLKNTDRDRYWYKTVDAKTRNQLSLASHLAADHEKLPLLAATAQGVKPHKESLTVRTYWTILGDALFPGEDFKRLRKGKGATDANAILNYGYAVLLSTTLQKLFGVGIDPTFGIAHATREHSTPLAYDLMEPFRPLVDWMVAKWVKENPSPQDWGITKKSRAWVTSLATREIEYNGTSMQLQAAVESSIRSFRNAVLAGKIGTYQPWIQRDSKWDG